MVELDAKVQRLIDHNKIVLVICWVGPLGACGSNWYVHQLVAAISKAIYICGLSSEQKEATVATSNARVSVQVKLAGIMRVPTGKKTSRTNESSWP